MFSRYYMYSDVFSSFKIFNHTIVCYPPLHLYIDIYLWPTFSRRTNFPFVKLNRNLILWCVKIVEDCLWSFDTVLNRILPHTRKQVLSPFTEEARLWDPEADASIYLTHLNRVTQYCVTRCLLHQYACCM